MSSHPGSWTFEYELPVRVRVRVEEADEHDGERAEIRADALVRTWLASLPGARHEHAELAATGDGDDLVLERDDFEYAPTPPAV